MEIRIIYAFDTPADDSLLINPPEERGQVEFWAHICASNGYGGTTTVQWIGYIDRDTCAVLEAYEY